MFENKGLVVLEKTDNFDSDNAMELALDLNALDCEDDEVFTVVVEPNADAVEKVNNAFVEKGYTVISASVDLVPQNYVDLDDKHKETFYKMIDKLEDSDDVQEVIHNLAE